MGEVMDPVTYLDKFKDNDIRIRASAIIASGKAGDRNAIRSLIEILENKSEVDWLRGCAAIALGRLSGEEVLLPLINALQDDSNVVARAAISALGDVKNEQAISPLQTILEDENKEALHAITITVLGKIAGYEIMPILLRTLESSTRNARIRAALALGDLRTEEAVVPFTNLLKTGDGCLRAIAASSLGLIGEKRAVEPLIEALDDRDENVRAIAASSLGCLNDIRAVLHLEKASDDESQLVRKQAASALSKIRPGIKQEKQGSGNKHAGGRKTCRVEIKNG